MRGVVAGHPVRAAASAPPAPTILGANINGIDVDYNGVDVTFSFANDGGAAITSVEVQVDATPVRDGISFYVNPAVYTGGPLTWAGSALVINGVDGIPIGSHNARARGTNSAGAGAWSANYPFTI